VGEGTCICLPSTLAVIQPVGTQTSLPGYTRPPPEPAHGYPRTAGEGQLTALAQGVTELTVGDASLTVTVVTDINVTVRQHHQR